MIHDIPLTITINTTSGGLKTLFYRGTVADKPCYSENSNTIELFWKQSAGCWVYSGNQRSWKNSAQTDRVPFTGWSDVSHDPNGSGSGVDTLTINAPVSSTLPAAITIIPSSFGEAVYDSNIIGWVSSSDQYTVLLHPTSPFNLSDKWALQQGDNQIGQARIDDQVGFYSLVPETINGAYNIDDIVATISYAAVSESTLTQEVYAKTVLFGYVEPLTVSAKDSDASYGTYVTSMLTGGRSISPKMLSRQGVYKASEIYDPDEDYDLPVAEINKLYIPAADSIVIDSTTIPGQVQMFVVKEIVDTPKGPKTILATLSGGVDNGGSKTTLINVANDLCMAFFILDADGPTKMTIDSKLVAMGENAGSYRLSRPSGEVISAELDGSDVNYGDIELVEENGVVRLPPCWTNYDIEEGEPLILTMHDSYNSGSVVGQITIYAKSAEVISELQLPSSVITELRVGCNQENNGGFYLLQNQNPNDLALSPKLLYSDNSLETLPLAGGSGETFSIDDGVLTYGLSAVDSSADVGTTFAIGFKYYIPKNSFLDDTIATGTDSDGPYVAREYTLTILNANTFSNISKMAIIPEINNNIPGDDTFTFSGLGVVAYMKDQSSPIIMRGPITDANLHLAISTAANVEDIVLTYGGPYGNFIQQTATTYTEGTVADFTQTSLFTQQDEGDSTVYGANGSIPSARLIKDGVYSFSIVADAITNLTEFLNIFYYNSAPPVMGESIPTPTHFRYRLYDTGDNNGFMIATAPIDVAAYGDAHNTLTLPVLPTGIRVGIIEFLKFDGGEYKVLFGAPVSTEISEVVPV